MQQLDNENLLLKNAGNTKETLINLGLITIGTQVATAAIHRIAKHPALLFGIGMAVGLYVQKNRKQIILSGGQLLNQGKKLIHQDPEPDSTKSLPDNKSM